MSDSESKDIPKHKKIGVTLSTPAYGGLLCEGYFHGVLKLSSLFSQQKDWKLHINTMGNESLITRARNTLVAQFLDLCEKEPEEHTHLMFIDADIGFTAASVKRMIDFDKDIVTGVYPRKSIDWQGVEKMCKKGEFDMLEQKSLGYNINFVNPKNIQMDKGFVEVLDSATGFMLIKKEVFFKLIKAFPYLKYTTDQIINGQSFKSNNCYAFFDCIIDEKSNRYLSEDYAFCRLWQKIKGKIYADLMSPLTHYGTHAFKGNIWSKFSVAEKDKHKLKGHGLKKEKKNGDDIHKSNK
jgi:hypothetical protein|tara:strand:+ start:1620 stop:2504 length:885 start_codon:yes stop_codon:yes gene_type:complete